VNGPLDEQGCLYARLRAAIARREFWLQQQELAQPFVRAQRVVGQFIAMYDADIERLTSVLARENKLRDQNRS
jgi:hypothetical protein